jgi:hypothetical protein
MAIDPQFAAIPVVGSAALSAFAASVYATPSNTVTLLGGQGPRQVVDGSTTLNSTTLTSVASAYNSGDIGRPVSGSGIPTGTIISGVGAVVGTTASVCTLSAPATATAASVSVTYGGGIGTLIQEIAVIGTGTTIAAICNTFLYDSFGDYESAGTYHFHDSFIVTAVTPSTSTAPFRLVRDYQNLWLPPGWFLVAGSFTASQLANVVATGLNA